MDPKKLAMIIGIAILLPLFVGLFIDAIYSAPEYRDFCNKSEYVPPVRPGEYDCNVEFSTEYQECLEQGGIPRLEYTDSCPSFKECDFCNKEYRQALENYNKNLFFIIAPIGLIIVVLGLYLAIDYLGAGLMFAGLITLFYATLRAFPDLGKLTKSLVILIELLIIMWIGYKKIDKK